jgi:hypothetical protein
MISDRKATEPQDFLDIFQELLGKREYVTSLYLVEYNKPTVNRRSDSIDIQVEDVVATPVRALRWDYLIGDEPINNRDFIIANNSYAEYLLQLYKPSGQFIKLVLYRFLKTQRVYPHLLTEDNLVSGVEKKLELNKDLTSEKIEVLENDTRDDKLLNDLLVELKRISKE